MDHITLFNRHSLTNFCAILCLLAVLFSASVNQVWSKTQFSDAAGSLVLVIPTNEGIVLAADKRLSIYTEPKTVRDDENKIVQIDRNTAVAGTGTSKIRIGIKYPHFETDVVTFDVSETVKEFFDEKSVKGSIHPYLTDCAVNLSNELIRCLAANPGHNISSENGIVAIARIIHFDPIRQRFEASSLTLFDKTNNFKVQIDNEPEGYHSCSSVHAFGRVEVCKELREGNNPKFDALRADPELKPFINSSEFTSCANISVDQATRAALKLISASAQNTGILNPSNPSSIGENADVALIDPKSGFHFLYQDTTYDRYTKRKK